MGVLNLNSQIIWVLINLLILFLLMRKFLFGPITRLLDARAKKVSDTLDQADSRLAEAEAQKTEYTQQLAAAGARRPASWKTPGNRPTWPTAAAWRRPNRPCSASTSRPPASGRLTGPPCWPRPSRRSRPW